MSQFKNILHDCSFVSPTTEVRSPLPPSESLLKSQFPKTTDCLLCSVQATEEVSLFLVWVPSSVTAKSLYLHTPQPLLPMQRNPDSSGKMSTLATNSEQSIVTLFPFRSIFTKGQFQYQILPPGYLQPSFKYILKFATRK